MNNFGNKLNFLFCFDNNYKIQGMVSIFSLLDNIDEKINIFIIYNENKLNDYIPSKIKNHNNLNSLKIYKFEDNNYDFPNIKNVHVTSATYYRMFIEKYLPPQINEVVYLDADTVCINNPIDSIIAKLKNLKESEFLLAANTEHHINENIEPEKFIRLNLNKSYFNAGVLIIDLEKWRKQNFTIKLLNTMKILGNKVLQWDQDILNSVINGSYIELEEELNFNSNKLKNHTQKNILFVHFIGSKKPWNTSGAFNFGSNYYHNNFYKIYSKHYHITHKWKTASVKETLEAITTLKILKLDFPIKYLKYFILSLRNNKKVL